MSFFNDRHNETKPLQDLSYTKCPKIVIKFNLMSQHLYVRGLQKERERERGGKACEKDVELMADTWHSAANFWCKRDKHQSACTLRHITRCIEVGECWWLRCDPAVLNSTGRKLLGGKCNRSQKIASCQTLKNIT